TGLEFVPSMDINGLTEETSPTSDTDFIPLYDASASANKKVKSENLIVSFQKMLEGFSLSGQEDKFIRVKSDGSGLEAVSLTPSDVGTLIKTTETIRIAKTLFNSTLGSSDSFDLSSIDQTYDDLEVILVLRGSVAAATDGAYMFFNGDTTLTNYQ